MRSWQFRIVRSAIDGSINFLDNCWDDNEGESELRMGDARQQQHLREPEHEVVAHIPTTFPEQLSATAPRYSLRAILPSFPLQFSVLVSFDWLSIDWKRRVLFPSPEV
jgi:hypothetical protein